MLWIVVMLLLAPMTSLAIGVVPFATGTKQWSNHATSLCRSSGQPQRGSDEFHAGTRLHNDALTVRCGLLCYQIPFAEITVGVEVCNHPQRSSSLNEASAHQDIQIGTHILSPNQRDVIHRRSGANSLSRK